MPQATLSRMCKNNPQNGRKHLQIISLIGNLTPKSVDYSYNPTTTKNVNKQIEKWA